MLNTQSYKLLIGAQYQNHIQLIQTNTSTLSLHIFKTQYQQCRDQRSSNH